MIEVDLHIHLRRNGKPFLNSSSVELLREVHRCGSLRVAAMGLHCSYQHAWQVINNINRAAGTPVVLKQRGGVGGGGARLSVHGQRLLDEYGSVEREIRSFTRKLNAEISF